MRKNRINIRLDSGALIKRVPRVVPIGNFQHLIIRYNNEEYLVGDGDEYIRGFPSEFTLGKKLSKGVRL